MAFILVAVAWALFFWLSPWSPAIAKGPGTAMPLDIKGVDDHGVLSLVSGGYLCLAGIRAPGPAMDGKPSSPWRSAWQDIIRTKRPWLTTDEPDGQDRYGCRLTRVETADGVSLQAILLDAGWAAVDPISASGDPRGLRDMLAREDRARRAGRGIWRDPAMQPKKADALSGWIGTRQIVEGKARRVSETDRYVYVNFGADWRTDFTLRLHRKMVDEAGFEIDDFEGRALRVRGVLQDSRGPLIHIFNLQQIEFLP